MTTDRSRDTFTLLAGIGIGAALMYILDPGRGARRRHLVADKALGALRSGRQAIRDQAVDAQHRVAGRVAELRGRLHDEEVDDDQLVARVRSQLGHHVEHARAIEVVADHGTVTLRGTVLADELPKVVAGVEGVRGVRHLHNQLAVQEPGGEAPSPQA